MDYHLLSDPDRIHAAFQRRFTLPYGAFCRANADWLASLPVWFRRGYTQSYFARLPYSDRLRPEFQGISFSDALTRLKQMGPVLFLTNPPGGLIHDYALLGTGQLWAAHAEAPQLAEAIGADWFRQYALWDQDMYDPEPLFASEVFAFTPDQSKCIVFTHETDETERPDTRICLAYGL